ncbi:Golgi transport complex subunit 5-domain-containing protein [Colletotrichum navitas]|uniref:Conserved oligomeric Golgi complex subunit 5 n=1 Tax=Colletotrichum navitas TaxID=681940 RepID=A0AAD8V207_9PEZI|nr:Golgi transport complex subunit 5-domain-containing protein [Colletotrichum navitas]KAK1579248.1 Golgi transport complex subunit 5-domain-containing protein [Colletotrichum navitas]
MTTSNQEDPSYIDYEAFLDPAFNPSSFANTLVLATNNPSDVPLDLSTPLSRVLFDTQEIDSHIDSLTSKQATPLLTYTQEQTASSKRIISELDAQIKSLNDSYKQLEKEVIDKHAEAEEVRQVATRLWETLKLGRSVGRCLQLGRQLEVQHAEIAASSPSAAAAAAAKKEDHRALVRCSHTILSLREILDNAAPGEEGHGLARVDAVRTLRDTVVAPIERSARETAEKIIRDFAIPESATFAQGEETKARTVSGMVTLFLLSPTPTAAAAQKTDRWAPQLLLAALEGYLRSALQSSIASMSRSLAQLSTLERTFAEISARCQNIVALELVLESTKLPTHPLVAAPQKQTNMLQPLLAHLETGSLPSYFWRTMAGSLGSRVQEIVTRGGAVARSLKASKVYIGEGVRECVVKGCQMPSALKGKTRGEGNWEREVAVMVGSVVNNMGR